MMIKNEKSYLKYNGFNEDGITYSIVGDNTYAIKDSLKEQGCKYSPLFGWHCSNPSTISFCPFNYMDYMIWDNRFSRMIEFNDAKEKVQAIISSYEKPKPVSNYFTGEVGDKIHDVPVQMYSRSQFLTRFGYTNKYKFIAKDVYFVYTTQKDIDIEKDKTYLLSGTIKGFEEYKGIKNTLVTRCSIKEINDDTI